MDIPRQINPRERLTMKDFIITAVAALILSAALALAMIYGIPALARAYYPEPNHDAYRAEQYHKYLVRKGYVNENE